MTAAYATLRDVYDLGLSAHSFVVRPRPLDRAAGDYLDAATGTFSLIGHDLTADDLVRLVLIARGGSLPGGANAITIYHPLPLDYWRFRLSASENGSALTFTDAGTFPDVGASAWGIQRDPERRLERIILAVSGDIDQDLTAHSTPLEPDPDTGKFPEKIAGIVARESARIAIAGLLFDNAASKIPAERLERTAKADADQRAAWRLGQPIYPTPVDQTANLADNGMRASSGSLPICCSRPPVCWQKGAL